MHWETHTFKCMNKKKKHDFEWKQASTKRSISVGILRITMSACQRQTLSADVHWQCTITLQPAVGCSTLAQCWINFKTVVPISHLVKKQNEPKLIETFSQAGSNFKEELQSYFLSKITWGELKSYCESKLTLYFSIFVKKSRIYLESRKFWI